MIGFPAAFAVEHSSWMVWLGSMAAVVKAGRSLLQCGMSTLISVTSLTALLTRDVQVMKLVLSGSTAVVMMQLTARQLMICHATQQ